MHFLVTRNAPKLRQKKDKKWSLESVTDVQKRRYLLRNNVRKKKNFPRIFLYIVYRLLKCFLQIIEVIYLIFPPILARKLCKPFLGYALGALKELTCHLQVKNFWRENKKLMIGVIGV